MIGGIAAFALAVLVQYSLLWPFLLRTPNLAVFSIGVGVSEEMLKPIGLLIVALAAPSLLQSKKEGLIHGALAGAGFGVVESLFYITISPSAIMVAGRLVAAIPLHIGLSAMVGLGFSYAVRQRSYLKLLLLLAVPIAIHAIWDFAWLKYALGG